MLKIYKTPLFIIAAITLMGTAITSCESDTTSPNSDKTAPTVTSTSPVNLDSGVATNSKVTALFSEDMDPSSLTAATFITKKGDTIISGAITYTDTSVSFTPNNNFAHHTTYTTTVTVGVKDLKGNAIASNYSWSYTTVPIDTADPIVDIVIPTVTTTTPVNLNAAVAINSAITANFSEAIDPLSLTAATFITKKGDTIVSGSVTHTNTSVSFTPNGNFAYSTIYTTTVTTGVKDLSGNAIANNYTWSYTTVPVDTTNPIVDTIVPTVTTTTPVNLDSVVAINSTITANFSEAIDPLSLTAANFITKKGDAIVSGSVTHTNTSVSFTPNGNFAYSTIYTTTVTTGVKDLSGNTIAGNYTWSYTTAPAEDTIAPTAILVLPASATTNIAINSQAKATFSEAMNVTTINTTTFTVANGATPVPGTVTYDLPNKTAIFSPSVNLNPEVLYTATLTTGVKDINDNALAVNKVWTFTTAASGLGPDPVKLGTASNFVILAKAAISTVPASIITGDIGVSPAAETYITGFSQVDGIGYATSPQVTGFIYAADMAPPIPSQMTTAIADMETAYTDAAGRITPDFTNLGTGIIGGLTLAPGLYTWGSSVTIPTDITISGGANDVWIFQIAGDISTSAAVKIILSGGAQSKNIFWQVSGEAVLGATSQFEGIILSKTAIRMGTGATLKGRALAQTQVSLDQNTVTQP